MKYLILPIFAIGFLLSSCNKKIEKNEANLDQFVNTCMNEAKKNYSDVFSEDEINKYCSCSAEKALDNFTAGELLKLNAPKQYPELQERFLKTIEPCINDLSNKVK